MSILKSSILVACIIGIISCIVDIGTPEGALKKQTKIIISIILILAVFLPFIDGNLDLDFDTSGLTDNKKYEQLSEDFRDMYSGMATGEMEKTIYELISNEGIKIERVSIQTDFDEYNLLEANKIIINAKDLNESDKDTIRKIITENLPDIDIEFTVQ